MWTAIIYLTFFFAALLFPSLRSLADLRKKAVRRVFVIYFLCVGTIVLLSISLPERLYRIPELQKIISKQKPGSYSEYEVYDKLRKVYPDSFPVQFRYVDLYREKHASFCPYHIDDEFSTNPEVQLTTETYAALQCGEMELSGLYLDSLQRTFPENRYLNFLEGEFFMHHDQRKKAGVLYEKAIQRLPHFNKSYLRLLKVYANDPKQLHAYVTAPGVRPHLPVSFRRTYFYDQGDWLYYAESIAESRIFSVSWLPFFSALILSMVWLYYIRNLDIFNPERWRDLFAVFVLGTGCTFLCLPLYDFAHYTLGFRLSGDALNDFLYCTFVIGLNEELVKFLPWILFTLAARKLKEPYDYILYASVAALGFAFAENWMYLEHSENIVSRFLMAVMAHMMDASIVAYAFILARFRFRKKTWKWLTPIIGFFLACLFHGFYDFWLISEAAHNYGFVTILFFLLTVHLWFIMKNNAVNNSAFFNAKLQFGQEENLRILMYGILGSVMLGYISMTIQYGADDANTSLYANFNYILFFSFYLTALVSSIRIRQGEWRPLFKTGNMRFFRSKNSFADDRDTFGSGNQYAREEYIDYQGQELRLFMPKSNRYLGAQFPVSGRCLYPVSVDGQDFFYVFKLNRHIHYSGMVPDKVIIRQASMDRQLTDDKVEIMMLLIPDEDLLKRFSFNMRELRYVGKAYSRPI